MAHTPSEERSKHQQHSMFVVDAESEGYEVLRPMMVFGHDDAPHGHMHVRQAEKALELLCKRSLEREAFGKQIAFLGANFDIIAESRIKIEQARLLCLKAAWAMDTAEQAYPKTRRSQGCIKGNAHYVTLTAQTPSTAVKSPARNYALTQTRRFRRQFNAIFS